MANKKRLRWAAIFGTVLILLLFSCWIGTDYLVYEPGQHPNLSALSCCQATGSFTIQADSILASLAAGKDNVFMPFLANTDTTDPTYPLQQNAITWRQADCLEVANAVFDYVWKEPAAGWRVYGLSFDRACQDNPSGFADGTIAYFKSVRSGYTFRIIKMDPQSNEVDWGGDSFIYDRPILGWASIDVARQKFTADDALKLAEANGGKAAREAAGNRCRIMLVLFGDNRFGWDVYYDMYDAPLSSFSISVNPYGGGVHK